MNTEFAINDFVYVGFFSIFIRETILEEMHLQPFVKIRHFI